MVGSVSFSRPLVSTSNRQTLRRGQGRKAVGGDVVVSECVQLSGIGRTQLIVRSLSLQSCEPNLLQEVKTFLSGRQARQSKRLPTIRSGCRENLMRVSYKLEQDASHGFAKPVQRTSRLRFFKQSALPLDPACIETETGVDDSKNEEPWLGSIIFKRSGFKTHYEFQTSLERLGLAVLSSEASISLAHSIGIVSINHESGLEQCTPVGISIDVSREGRDLRLNGFVRTAISLCCNRCLSPVVERVFANFSVLLTEKVVKEPTQPRIGVVLGQNNSVSPDEYGGELDIDLDDKLHFPRESKEMDLSKHIRDTVHLEIPSKSLCSGECRGLCLTCGVNLNKNSCKCVDVKVKPSWGPLEQLKLQLEEGKPGDGSEEFPDGPA